jgi:hypothetical protein
VSGDKTPRKTQKEERTRRLEEQLRDNLRKRKELSRARKVAASRAGDGRSEQESGTGDASDAD